MRKNKKYIEHEQLASEAMAKGVKLKAIKYQRVNLHWRDNYTMKGNWSTLHEGWSDYGVESCSVAYFENQDDAVWFALNVRKFPKDA
jgi:hypothetical protein